MIGQSLDELYLRSRHEANVVGIERWRKFRRVMFSATGGFELREQDVLLLDISVSYDELRQFCFKQKVEPMILRGDYFSEQSRDVGMAAVSINPNSELLSKSLHDIKFRTRYGLNVVGIRRGGKALTGKLVAEPLRFGDILLVIGDWKLIRILSAKPRNFIVLNLVVEVKAVVPASS